MESLDILIIISSFKNLDILEDRIYSEIERDGYFNLTTETKDGIQQSIFIFKNLKNKALLDSLHNGYAYLNYSDTYFGKVIKMEKYVAKEYTGSPIRIMVHADNGKIYDIPEKANDHLNCAVIST